ncbi:Protein of unknown function [Gryllus bimaculatus]|nr:Protein of unknown function [Gryllus bimaculatus]
MRSGGDGGGGGGLESGPGRVWLGGRQGARADCSSLQCGGGWRRSALAGGPASRRAARHEDRAARRNRCDCTTEERRLKCFFNRHRSPDMRFVIKTELI